MPRTDVRTSASPRRAAPPVLRRPRAFAAALSPLTLATLWAVPAHAEDWVPGLRLYERLTLTDNVHLSDTNEQTAFVLQTSPELSLRRSTDRTYTQIEYRPSLYLYSNSIDDTTVWHQLNSLYRLEAVDDFFFVEARARAIDSFFSPFQPGTWGDVANVDNRLQNWSLGVSPYIRGMSPDGYRYLLRNDTWWTTTNKSLPDELDSRVTGRFDAPDRGRTSWSATYNYHYTRYQDSPSFYEQQARLIGYYRVNPDLAVSARGGYETNDYSTDTYGGAIYGGGLDWTPNPRTTVSGFAEHRFFGTGYQADLRYRTRITSWRLRGLRDTRTYRDDVFALPAGDTRELLDATFSSRIPDPIEREQAVEDFLATSGLPPTLNGPVNFFTNRVYTVNRVDAMAGLFGVRNAVTFTLFYRENDPVTTNEVANVPEIFNFSNKLQQRGGVVEYSYNFDALSALTTSVRRTYSKSTELVNTGLTDFTATENVFRIALSRRLTPDTTGAVGLRWVNFDTDRPNSSYDEQAVFVAVSHRFF